MSGRQDRVASRLRVPCTNKAAGDDVRARTLARKQFHFGTVEFTLDIRPDL